MESASTRATVSAVTRRIGVAVLPYLLVEKDILANGSHCEV